MLYKDICIEPTESRVVSFELGQKTKNITRFSSWQQYLFIYLFSSSSSAKKNKAKNKKKQKIQSKVTKSLKCIIDTQSLDLLFSGNRKWSTLK